MSDKSVDEEALQDDLVATDILAFGEHIARIQSRDLSPQQQTVAIDMLSAMISTLRGTSKNLPVNLDNSPQSSQGKSSCSLLFFCLFVFLSFLSFSLLFIGKWFSLGFCFCVRTSGLEPIFFTTGCCVSP